MSSDRDYDIVLFGATGFAGGLTAEYLGQNAPAGTRWAIAGRSETKLIEVKERLVRIDPRCAEVGIVLADSSDAPSLQRLAGQTRVVATTVGPFVEYGEALVAACAAAGTDYVDITGEPEFVDRMWLSYHEQAKKTGARLVHCCGFDSIPHDLGAFFTVQQLPEGQPITLNGFVRASATFSAATYHSAVHAFSRVRKSSALSKQRRGRENRSKGRRVRAGVSRPFHQNDLDGWAVPLPTIDPVIVRRSARALDRYGPDFTYGHYALVKGLPTVVGSAVGVGGLFALAQLPPTKKLLLGLKQAGEGPSAEKRAQSWFKVRFIGEGGGRRVVTEVAGGDPGYDETAKMLAESALCLVYDDLPELSGQLTTAQAMGNALIDRLQRAGITFRVLEDADA